jgi:hypothetical protein
VSRAARRTSHDAAPEPTDNSLLDLLDNLLNKGVVVTGELTLGLAGIDLVYLELSALLAAADRVLPLAAGKRARSLPAQTTLAGRLPRPRALGRAAPARRDAAGAERRDTDRGLRRRAPTTRRRR